MKYRRAFEKALPRLPSILVTVSRLQSSPQTRVPVSSRARLLSSLPIAVASSAPSPVPAFDHPPPSSTATSHHSCRRSHSCHPRRGPGPANCQSCLYNLPHSPRSPSGVLFYTQPLTHRISVSTLPVSRRNSQSATGSGRLTDHRRPRTHHCGRDTGVLVLARNAHRQRVDVTRVEQSVWKVITQSLLSHQDE